MAKSQTNTKSRAKPETGEALVRVAAEKAMPLNFKVPPDFRREFKTYAARHNKKLNQLLYEAFAALKARND